MAVLKMWGNSAALRIATPLLETSHFAIDEPLRIRAEPGRIVIESFQPTYDIDELVAAITPANQPPLQAHAKAVGAEVIEW
jgi:antitoxin MazE